jgi:tetratricopeptide (TPR) repeat protein
MLCHWRIRKLRILLVALTLLLFGVAAPPAPTLESIARSHVDALGGIGAIRSVTSVVEHGWYREGTFQIDTFAAQMRPFYRVIGDPNNPLGEIHEGYDGSAWEYYPDPGIVLRTVGDAAAAGRHAAAFDDPLVTYPGKSTALTIGEATKLLGSSELVVHATLADGFAEDLYVNPSTWMIDAEKRVVPMHAFGKRYTTIDLLGDYRLEGGVMRAHSFKEVDGDTGKILTQSAVTKVDINPPLVVSMFAPPTWDRSPLQAMIQRIYDERDESRAVMATYLAFSSIVDVRAGATGDAIDFVGYQCLKMGHTDTAIPLLKQNVLDHPLSARAHFGLGRAEQAAGNREEARIEYQRALAIDPTYERAKEALATL